MTKSPSEPRFPKVGDYPKEKPATRTYSVLPARAIQDDSLSHNTLRVLGAICIHTNAYGICWPSLLTLARHVNVRAETVSRHVQKLIKAGYIRKLQRKAYPIHVKRKSPGITNRYQVLFNGNDPLPTKEQFEAPRPKIVEEPSQLADNDDNNKRSGGLGDGKTDFRSLAHAFRAGVERASGAVRMADKSLQTAQMLGSQGVTADEVRDAAIAMTRENLRRGASPPMTLEQVAKWAKLYKN